MGEKTDDLEVRLARLRGSTMDMPSVTTKTRTFVEGHQRKGNPVKGFWRRLTKGRSAPSGRHKRLSREMAKEVGDVQRALGLLESRSFDVDEREEREIDIAAEKALSALRSYVTKVETATGARRLPRGEKPQSRLMESVPAFSRED